MLFSGGAAVGAATAMATFGGGFAMADAFG